MHFSFSFSFIAKLGKSFAKASLYSDFFIRLVENVYSAITEKILLNSAKKYKKLEKDEDEETLPKLAFYAQTFWTGVAKQALSKFKKKMGDLLKRFSVGS